MAPIRVVPSRRCPQNTAETGRSHRAELGAGTSLPYCLAAAERNKDGFPGVGSATIPPTEVRCRWLSRLRSPSFRSSASNSTSTSSSEHFALELERFWRRGWLFVCHESEIAARGQYVRYDLAGDSVVVVRGEEGAVHALHNVCRHRGSPLVSDERGACRARLVCPFHGWSYDLDGTVRTTPKMHDGFDRTGWDLKRVWVEVWNGMVFISLAQEAPEPVAERLAGADFSGYDLGGLKIAWERDYVLEANWKLAWEGGLECYHCGINHPELCTRRSRSTTTATS